jgi:hypothetical protein
MNVVCNFVLNHQAVFATGTWAFRAHFWKFLPPSSGVNGQVKSLAERSFY